MNFRKMGNLVMDLTYRFLTEIIFVVAFFKPTKLLIIESDILKIVLFKKCLSF